MIHLHIYRDMRASILLFLENTAAWTALIRNLTSIQSGLFLLLFFFFFFFSLLFFPCLFYFLFFSPLALKSCFSIKGNKASDTFPVNWLGRSWRQGHRRRCSFQGRIRFRFFFRPCIQLCGGELYVYLNKVVFAIDILLSCIGQMLIQ